MSELEKESSTGCSYLRHYGTTIGQALGWDGVKFDQERLDLLKMVVEQRMQGLLLGDLQADNIKLFIKQEPHKKKKVDEGMWRLISAVSPVDSLIDRIIFGSYMSEVVENFQRYPCKVGWSPVRGGFRYIASLYRGSRTVCLDKSGWDWTVPAWLVDEWLRFILWTIPEDNEFARTIVRARFKILFEQARFEFQDGTVVEQAFKGLMKSGCYLTIFLNSLGQSMMHYAAMRILGKNPLEYSPNCIGDDTVQKFFEFYEQYRQALRSLGCQPKEAEIRDHVEFAGFHVYADKYLPAYRNKHMFNFKYMDEKVAVDALYSMLQLYVFDEDMFNFTWDLIHRRSRVFLPPKDVFSHWATGLRDNLSG